MTRTGVPTELIPFDEAKNILADAVETLSSEYLPLSGTLGRIAAESIVAEEDLVPYPRSAMDGYVLRAADTESATPGVPLALPVAGKIFTGDGRSKHAARTVMGITTGAPVPVDADAVVPHELVSVRQGMIYLERPVAQGACIFPPAEDVRRGEVVPERGNVVGPGSMALLAFMGRSEVLVYRRPCVSLVCTGRSRKRAFTVASCRRTSM